MRLTLFSTLLIVFGACADSPPSDSFEFFIEPLVVGALASQYRCAHGAWPASAEELRTFESIQLSGETGAISQRTWEILDLCRFAETSDGKLLINGQFGAGAPPFPNSEAPINLNITLESEICD